MFNPFVGDQPSQPAKPAQPTPPEPTAQPVAGKTDDDARWEAAWSKPSTQISAASGEAESVSAPASMPVDGGPEASTPPPAKDAPMSEPSAQPDKPAVGWGALMSDGSKSESTSPEPEPVADADTTRPVSTPDWGVLMSDEAKSTSIPEPVAQSDAPAVGWSSLMDDKTAPEPESPSPKPNNAPASDWRSMVAMPEPSAAQPRMGAWGRRDEQAASDEPSPPVSEPDETPKRGWGRREERTASDEPPSSPSESDGVPRGAWGRHRSESGEPSADVPASEAPTEVGWGLRAAGRSESEESPKCGWGRADASGKADDADGTDVGWIDDLGDPDDGLDDAPGSSFSNASAARMVGMVVAVLLALALVVGGGLYVGRLVSARRAAAARDEACRSWSVALGDYRQAVRDAKALGLKTVKAASVCPTDTDDVADGTADLRARTKRVEKQVRTKVAGEWSGTADKLAKVKTSYPSVSADTADRAAVLAKRAPSSKRELDSLKAQAKTVLDDAASEQKKADDAAAKRKAEDERAAQEKAAAEESQRQAEARQQRSTPSYTPTYTPSYTPSYTPTYTAPKTQTTTPEQSAPKQTTPPPSGSNTFSD